MVRHGVRKRFPWPARALAQLPHLVGQVASYRELARLLKARGLVRAVPDAAVVRRAVLAGGKAVRGC